MTAEENFAKLGLELPPAPSPMGVYKPCLIVDNFIYVSGHGPVQMDGSRIIVVLVPIWILKVGKLAAQQVGLTHSFNIKS